MKRVDEIIFVTALHLFKRCTYIVNSSKRLINFIMYQNKCIGWPKNLLKQVLDP